MKKPRRDAGRARGAPIVDAVLAHTLEELAESGVDGLSVERIARRAQVNKTSVYRRWPTRDALIVEALEAQLRQFEAQVPDTGSLEGDLLGLLQPVAVLLGDPRGKALVRAAFAESSASGVAALAARGLAPGSARPMRAMVKRAVARGEWKAGVKPEDLLCTLVGSMIHRAMLQHQPLSSKWVRSLVRLSLYGASPAGH